MMLITTYTDTHFKIDGYPFPKIYNLKVGTDDEKLTLENVNDTSDVIFRNRDIDKISIDAVVYDDADALFAAVDVTLFKSNVNLGKYDSTEIALGLIPGIDNLYKYGGSSSITTDMFPVWDKGGAYYWLPAASKLQVVSDNVLDKLGSGGAISVELFGLDANKDEISEVVTLDGTTPVETIKLFFRCFRVIINTGDTRVGLLGDLSVYETGVAANVVAMVKAGKNQTHMAIYTVPNGKCALIDNADANCGAGKEAEVELVIFDNLTINAVELVKATRYIYQNSFLRVYKTPRKVPAGTDIWMRAKADTGTIKVSASFEIRLFNI